ncbi:GLPGLI family protein [uncultured Sphingobacterium sp.]|uniref:GLPGLI family protein n=1 Tax=uncultured Sphingobacterium sp. TaxID=182688 RepID=UPI002600A45A|nr:GLPGLI family protein [uncultured Sphingobacterium sp.]
MKWLYFILLLLTASGNSKAQFKHIIQSGVIDFEFKINRYERVKEILSDQASFSKYRDFVLYLQNNKFLTRKYQMDFDKEYSNTRLTEKENIQDLIDLLIGIPTARIVQDFTQDSIYIEKKFSEETFYLAEKVKKITWKYTDERMEIVGYECRRVNGLLMDSIYIVAFYCPEIEVTGGPAGISGLPGMILGLSIPQEHINIFATKIDLDTATQPGPIKKSKYLSTEQFEIHIKSILGDRITPEKWNMTKRALNY